MLSMNLAILATLVARVGEALVIKEVQSSPRADTLNQDIVRVLYQPKSKHQTWYFNCRLTNNHSRDLNFHNDFCN